MKYEGILPARFLDRPNRFIAHALLDGETVVCHVKNTGRCKELLVPGAEIWLQRSCNPKRKTTYDLIAVQKGQRLINMDANAPNTVFGEYLRAGGLGFVPELVRPETRHGDSRFDFYFEHGGVHAFAEVKGVTLEDNGVVRFPDAPTERGVKHLRGLADCVREGYEAWAVFIIQMGDVRFFEPNWKTHSAFGDALMAAREAGVHLLALACAVEPDSLTVGAPAEIRLDRPGDLQFPGKSSIV